MEPAPADTVLSQLRVLLGVKGCEHLADAELLCRVVERRDEAALTVLVRRHGGRVLKVCRNVLHREADAEDAFQATFLVFARKAASIRKRTAISSWLHGVALRCAKKLQKNAMRRSQIEKTCDRQPSPESPVSQAAWNELQSFLDEEIARLPEKYRAPFLLTCLEGKSRSEAAQILGCKEGTVASRVATAREILQKRLTARGVSLSAAMAAATLAPADLSAGVSVALASRTMVAALAFAAGAPAGIVPAQVLVVAQGVLNGMLISKLKLGVVLLLVASMTAAAARIDGPAADNQRQQQLARARFTPQEVNDNPEPQKQTGKDVYGDPLPDGAIARLGARRFRHDGYTTALAFTPDGKSLLGYTYSGVVMWDAATGVERYRIPARRPHHYGTIGISPDGSTLAIVEHVDDQPKITLWELATGRKIRTLPLPGLANYNNQFERLIFSADGKSLVLSQADTTGDGAVFVFDMPSGTIRRTLGGKGSRFHHTVAVSPDSASIAVVVSDRPNPNNTITTDHALQLLDILTGKIIRTLDDQSITGNLQVLAFSPDSKSVAHSNGGKVSLFDCASGKRLGQIKVTKAPRDLAFTPDGARLVFYDHEQGGIHIWDMATKQSVFALNGRLGPGSSMALSPDGTVVALGTHSSTVRLWETGSGKELFTEHEGHNSAINDLVFSPDGKIVVSTGDLGPTILWDTISWRKKSALPLGSKTLSFSPDGKRLAMIEATVGYERPSPSNKVRVWDVAAGKETATLSTAAVKVFDAANFSADGRKIFTLDRGASDVGGKSCIRHWDIATGTHTRFAVPSEYHYFAFDTEGKSIIATRYAIDEHSSALANMVCRELASGRERFIEPVNNDHATRPSRSSDGRLFAVCVSKRTERWWDHFADVRVCDVGTGKELFLLQGQKYSESSLAWSPDGRILATGTDRHDHLGDHPVLVQSIRLWDMATGKEFAKWDGIQADVAAMSFAPDGKTLVAGLRDGTLLVFDASKLEPPSKLRRPLTTAEAELIWKDLAGDNVRKAQGAAWQLVDAAKQSLPMLRNRLKPAAAVDAAKIKSLIADLDSATFAVRDDAAKQLKALGESAEHAIRAALKGDLSLEKKRRLNQLLDDGPGPQTLRSIRAIAVLERIGSPEAANILQTLSKGISGVRTTEEAAAALARLTVK